jgi:hypothetical protein
MLRAGGSGYRPQRLSVDMEYIGLVVQNANPRQIVTMLMPLIWVDVTSSQGAPGNLCTQAAHTLRHAYDAVGLRSEIVTMELVVTRPDGGGTRYGTRTPRYHGDDLFQGHCVLRLPDLGCVIDATAEQFPELAGQRRGPLIALETEPLTGHGRPVQLVGQRGDLLVTYTTVPDPQYAAHAYGGPNAWPDHQETYRLNGLRIVSQLLALLRLAPKAEARTGGGIAPGLPTLLDLTADHEWKPETGHGDRWIGPTGKFLYLRDVVPAINSSEIPPAQAAPAGTGRPRLQK